MPTINQLPTTDTLEPDDLLPVYSSQNGDARKASVNTLAQLVAEQVDQFIANPSNATPQPPSILGAPGIDLDYSRADHSHPKTGVDSVAVVSANGLAGTVANPTTTPQITISTTVTGVLKGNGTAISAATPGTDYSLPVTVRDEGIDQTTGLSVMNFTGAGVTATAVGGSVTVNVPGGGTGTVTNVSVASANGLAGTVATPTTTPVITLSTSVSGLLKGDGTAISAATAGADYSAPITTKDDGVDLTTATTSLNFTGAGVTATNTGGAVTVNIPGGGGSGTVTSVSVVSANGFAGTVANATTTPAITMTTSVSGLLKGDGTAMSAATSGTDYSAGTSALATGILKSTTGTGALSIAVAGDFPTLNQNTTGTAANVTGVVAVANGGTGLSAAPANGQLDIGNGTGFTRATLTAGSGISITNGSGSISIAATGGGSGSLTFLTRQTINAANAMDFLNIFTSAYDDYLIEVDAASSSGSGVIQYRFASGGTLLTTTIYNGHRVTWDTSGGAFVGPNSFSTTEFQTLASGGGPLVTARLHVSNVNSALNMKAVTINTIKQGSSISDAASDVRGWVATTSTLSGFRVFLSTGNFNNSGTITVWGMRNS